MLPKDCANDLDGRRGQRQGIVAGADVLELGVSGEVAQAAQAALDDRVGHTGAGDLVARTLGSAGAHVVPEDAVCHRHARALHTQSTDGLRGRRVGHHGAVAEVGSASVADPDGAAAIAARRRVAVEHGVADHDAHRPEDLHGTGTRSRVAAEAAAIEADRASKSDVERGGYHYSLGIVGFTAWGHTSFALGVARHALDELAEISKAKAGPFGILADAASFQEKYARAEAKYRASRALVYSAWNDLDETLQNEEPATNEQLALIKLAFRYSHEVSAEVCAFAYNQGGGIALRASPLQRCFRDISAGIQHVLLSDQIMQDCGKVLLGHVPQGAKMQLLGLH